MPQVYDVCLLAACKEALASAMYENHMLMEVSNQITPKFNHEDIFSKTGKEKKKKKSFCTHLGG